MQERIFKKLDLQNTGILQDLPDEKSADKKSQEVRSHLGQAVFVPGSKQNPHSNIIVTKHATFPSNYTTPLGAVHASCGGLYSSVDDLEKFSKALGNMIMGQKNPLTDELESGTRETISGLYRRQLSDFNYSLGVNFSKNGSEKSTIWHKGEFPGNFASMAVILPCDFDKLKSGKKIELETDQLDTVIFMQKFDYMVSTLFTERTNAIPNEILNEFINSRLTETEKIKFTNTNSEEIAKYLIGHKRLPENFFEETVPQVINAFSGVKKHLIENYLDEDGVINSKKIIKEFRTIGDVDKVINPIIAEGRKTAEDILSKLTKSLPETKLQDDSKSTIEKTTQEEKSAVSEPSTEKAGFVEKLGLETTEKPRSFVEAMRAGKYGNIGSKGGAHEL